LTSFWPSLEAYLLSLLAISVCGFSDGFTFVCYKADASGAEGVKLGTGFRVMTEFHQPNGNHVDVGDANGCKEATDGEQVSCNIHWRGNTNTTLFGLSYDVTNMTLSGSLVAPDGTTVLSFPDCKYNNP